MHMSDFERNNMDLANLATYRPVDPNEDNAPPS